MPLALYRAAAGRPRAGPPLLLVPGMFSNHSFFLGSGQRGLAHELAARGWDAWVGELRGPTRTPGAVEHRAWTFEDWISRDAPALAGAVLEATGAPRLVWIGHSAGAVVGAAFAGTAHQPAGRVAGLVLAGAPGPRLSAVRWSGAALVLGLTAMIGRVPARAVGLGPEDEAAGVVGQWLRWNLARRWTGADGTDYFRPLREVRVPALALAGGGDRLAPPDACAALLDAFGGADRTLVTCARAHGFGTDYDHVGLLASPDARREVWPVIAAWLERRFG